MKLPLLLLSFLFCFPSFGQEVNNIDWANKDFIRTKIPARKFKGSGFSNVMYTIKRHDHSVEKEYFPEDFKQTIDTIYKKISISRGSFLWTDTFYIERIANYIDDKGNADIQYFYPNGQLEKRVNYIATGKVTSYDSKYPTRKGAKEYKTYTINQRRGVANGLIKYYYPSGQIKKIEEYDNGVRNGKFYSYYKNGQIEEERKYKDKVRVGTVSKWYENGQIKEVSHLNNGLMEGKQEEFYENGQLKSSENYKVFKTRKSEEILIEEAIEQIKNYSSPWGTQELSSVDSSYIAKYDTLENATRMASYEKYYYLPYGEFQYFDRNGKSIYSDFFTEELVKQMRDFRESKEYSMGQKMSVLKNMKIFKRHLKIGKAAKQIREIEKVSNPECIKEVRFSLPFEIKNEANLNTCLSTLKVGIPDISKVELILPYDKEYQIFTQLVVLKNTRGDLHYELQYSSGQTFLNYNLNCKDLIERKLEKGYSTSVPASNLYSNSVKTYYRNGQLRQDAIYLKLPTDDEGYSPSSFSLNSKDYTRTGKILIDYSHKKNSEKYGECKFHIEKYYYDDNERLKGIELFFRKDKEQWNETIYFHPNGNVKRKTIKKSWKLHNWQELYNESGELIAKEKFEEGESVEFIKY